VLLPRRLQFNALRQLGQTTRQREQEMRDHIREARRQSLLVDQVGHLPALLPSPCTAAVSLH
jgi:hypothetical protein